MKRIFSKAGIIAIAILGLAGLAFAGVRAYKPSGDALREDVPGAYKWSLTSVYPSVAKWNESYEHVEGKLSSISLCKGKLGIDAAQTLQCLTELSTLKQEADALYAYAFQAWSVDMLNEETQKLQEEAIGLAARLGEAASFVDPELQLIPATKWEKMVAEKGQLQEYQFHYKDLKRREKHLLSSEMESIMAQTMPMREGPYTVMNSLAQEMSFPKIKDEDGKDAAVNFATFGTFRGSSNREVAKAATQAFFSTLLKFKNTLASSLATSVKGAVFEAKVRGYRSSLEQSLDADNVPVEVYTNLIKTTEKNLPKTLHRYVRLRKKLMKLDEIHYYDMYSPLFPDFQKAYTYDEATNLISDALRPMGQDYLTILNMGMEPGSGWTDVYPNKGKKGGAYCNAAYGTHPYVFLNHMNTLDDIFTVAHEFGHAMHFFLSHQKQPYPTSEAPIFLAEIASTFHEEMLLSYLLKETTTKEEKLVLLNKRIQNIRLTITRQTMFADFEMQMHAEVEKGGALTAARMSEIYAGIVKKYFGPDFTFDEHDAIEWAYIPHFYYNFYVYKYSTGLMSAIVFSQRVLEGKPGALAQYKNFLSSGGSDYPLNILMKSGIDFTSPEIVQSTYDLFERTLDEMEALLK